MKIKAVSCVFVAAILFSGCSGVEPEKENELVSDANVKITEVDESEAEAENLEEADASEDLGQEAPEADEKTESEVEPDEADNSEPTFSQRGNFVKEIGEIGGLVADDGDDLVTFKMTQIDDDFACTSEYAEKPLNGKFVGLEFQFETSSELMAELGENLWVSEFDFQAWDASGKRVNDPVGNAYMCVPRGEQLPSEIGSGEIATGWIILDLPDDVAHIGYFMGLSSSGWEWAL